MEKKDAITINLENAPSQIVVERMCAKGAEGPIHEVDAQHVIRYSSPLNLINLEFGLSNHPDKLFVEKILEYTKNGVPVGYSGPRKLRIHQNWLQLTALPLQLNNPFRKNCLKVARQVYSTCLHLIHLWGLPWAHSLKRAC